MSNPYNLLAPVHFEGFEFDGRICNVVPMPAKKAREVATKILSVLSLAMKETAAASPRTPALLEIFGSSAIMENVARAGMLEWLHGQFIDHTEVEQTVGGGDFMPLKGKEDLFFAGAGMGRWLRWIAFCIEVNCGSFFGELQRQGPLLKTKIFPRSAKSESPSPST